MKPNRMALLAVFCLIPAWAAASWIARDPQPYTKVLVDLHGGIWIPDVAPQGPVSYGIRGGVTWRNQRGLPNQSLLLNVVGASTGPVTLFGAEAEFDLGLTDTQELYWGGDPNGLTREDIRARGGRFDYSQIYIPLLVGNYNTLYRATPASTPYSAWTPGVGTGLGFRMMMGAFMIDLETLFRFAAGPALEDENNHTVKVADKELTAAMSGIELVVGVGAAF